MNKTKVAALVALFIAGLLLAYALIPRGPSAEEEACTAFVATLEAATPDSLGMVAAVAATAEANGCGLR